VNSKTTLIIFSMFVISLTSSCSLLQKNKPTNNTTSSNDLSIPPGLRSPVTVAPKISARQASQQTNKHYFIVVGTYPTQGQALDMFVRLSSIGLANATMESRQTKQGQILHMVRLGPYNNQDDIDKTKDTLTNDGLSQFKVVEN